MEFLQKEDVERRRLEEAEKVHLAEIQGLQVRVRPISRHLPRSACSLSREKRGLKTMKVTKFPSGVLIVI